MKTETEILTSLSDRVGRLERQNHLMKAAALGAVVLFLSSMVVSCQSQPASSTQKRVVAEEFVLVDSDGKKRGEWAMDTSDAAGVKSGTQFGSSLRLFAKDQSVLCNLSVGADSGGALIFGSKEGQHFSLVGSTDGMEMLAGAGIDKAVRLTSAQLSGGDIDGIPTYGKPITTHFLELRDENGKEVFNTANYYGYNPSNEKP